MSTTSTSNFAEFIISQSENISILWAQLIIEEVIRAGVQQFCVSSGSRSTPLTLALARAKEFHPHLEIKVITDERSAAFYALGYARATGKAAACICTSGTAVANYFPAVVEASQDAVPMLLLTADRPPELLDTGANQTIKQHGIFGDYVRWQFDLPCPSEAISPSFVLSTVSHAVFRAMNTPKGAVHLNCQFREPLHPRKDFISPEYTKPLSKWLHSSYPFTRYSEHSILPSDASIRAITQILSAAKFPLLSIGRLANRQERDAVMQFAYMWRVPIVADIASGLRLHDLPNTITHLDQILLSPEVLDSVQPDVVLHVGGSFVSKRLLHWFASISPEEFIVIEETPFRLDPNHQATMRIQCAIPETMKMLYKAASGLNAESALAVTSFQHSQTIEKILEDYLEKAKQNNDDISEITAAMLVSKYIPSETGLFLSNSMPIRDMDMYGLTQHESGYIHVGTNRGASGIDGILATASGFANGLKKPVTLMIGDLALIHDLNSTLIAATNHVPLIIIAINNNGGGIFSFLPLAQELSNNATFEQFWGTPSEVEFDGISHFAGSLYDQVETVNEFEKAYKKAITVAVGKNPRTSLIEIITHRDKNVEQHKELQAKIISALHA
jgi:2-succinyl-5-enolpyruvyl-6-hydroxy-3-cyclohexene-1-carboxylate synthase